MHCFTVSWFISKDVVQYNGVSSPHSNAKVIEILKKYLQLLCKDYCESIESILAFPADKLTQPKHRLTN